MRRRLAIIASTVAVLLTAAGAAVRRDHSRAAISAPPPVSPAVPVVAGVVRQGDVPIFLAGLGTVRAYNTVTIHTQVQGEIEQILFKEGRTVHKGDLLAQIDPRTFEAQLDQATAAKERDQAQLANERKNLDRFIKLGDFASKQTVDNQRALVAQLRAAVASDQGAIDNARTMLSYTRITSPIDGVTGIRQVDQGNIVHPTDPTGIVVVTQVEPITVIFTLPENDLARVQQRMSEGPLSVVADSQDDTMRLAQGRLELIDNQIDQTTATARLKAVFANHAHRLWPGEFVNIHLQLDTRPDGLTVPASVVLRGPHGTYAYVIKPDQTVETRPIKVAQIVGGRALIDRGLAAGEQIVVDGQSKLQPGDRVRILHGTAAAEAAAQDREMADIP